MMWHDSRKSESSAWSGFQHMQQITLAVSSLLSFLCLLLRHLHEHLHQNITCTKGDDVEIRQIFLFSGSAGNDLDEEDTESIEVLVICWLYSSRGVCQSFPSILENQPPTTLVTKASRLSSPW